MEKMLGDWTAISLKIFKKRNNSIRAQSHQLRGFGHIELLLLASTMSVAALVEQSPFFVKHLMLPR